MTTDDEFDMTDPPPTAEDLAIVASTSAGVLAALDKALLDAASTDWRKMARVVGNAMAELKSELPDLSHSYYVYRLRDFVASGSLEARGPADHAVLRTSQTNRCGLTPRWSGRVTDKVPSSNCGVRAAQLNR